MIYIIHIHVYVDTGTHILSTHTRSRLTMYLCMITKHNYIHMYLSDRPSQQGGRRPADGTSCEDLNLFWYLYVYEYRCNTPYVECMYVCMYCAVLPKNAVVVDWKDCIVNRARGATKRPNPMQAKMVSSCFELDELPRFVRGPHTVVIHLKISMYIC
jgi:hypothetical protein